MANNFYIKKGNTSKEEKKYIQELQKFFDTHPEVELPKPAKTFGHLKRNYEKYCVSDVEFEETPSTGEDENEKELDRILEESKNKQASQNGESTHEDFRDGLHENIEQNDFSEEPDEVIDPFNRHEPIVRDYVTDDKFSQNGQETSRSTQTSFAEPTNFNESFEMPKDGPESSNGGKPGESKKTAAPKTEPINPEFNSIPTAIRNRKTKRMAKNIVNVFCFILKEGVPKWATRDITPEALAAQAKNGEINLDVLLSFDGETQIHITEYFKQMCETAKTLGEIPEQLQEELKEDLYDLLIEKGVTPTPMQSLLLTFGEILILVGMKTYSFRAQISAVKAIASNAAEASEEQTYKPAQHEEEAAEALRKQQQETKEQETRPSNNKQKEGNFLELEEGRETKE